MVVLTSNTFGGRCRNCAAWVAPGGGFAIKGRRPHEWAVFCDVCPTAAPPESAGEIVATRSILADAMQRPDRLTAWELGFCETIAARIERLGERIILSERQQAALKRIEAKVYAT